ncbi:hypothetical protein Y032_0020g129 [Ancylostoma ceylanicum]|uniref:Uncharacterized protein n=1 Tax=Ancylostoma ceylanicum TaxID=53326 RepID=A0A016V0Y0_9BILA|nr:hypothetical protein Y032_0020g129 [Ancylostoma ceylanicum]
MRVQLVSIFDAFNYVKTAPCIGYPCIPPPKFSFHNKQCLLLVYIRVAACLPHSVMKSAGEPSILRARSCYATYRRNNGITAFGTGKAGEHRRSEQWRSLYVNISKAPLVVYLDLDKQMSSG